MTSSSIGTLVASIRQSTRCLADAVRESDYEQFCHHTQMSIIYHGTKRATYILNRLVPLELELKHIPTLLRFMTGEDGYIKAVQSMLAETIKSLSEAGLIFGVDMSCSQKGDGTPVLLMTSAAVDVAAKVYMRSAWKQALPYVKVIGR